MSICNIKNEITDISINNMCLPIFSRNLAQYRPYTKPIVTFTMTSNSKSRSTRARPMDGTLLGHVPLLPRQTILELRKLEFGTASVRCCTENKCWQPKFGPELAAKCITELSFQKWHDIGNRYSANFWRCWASVGPHLTSHVGSQARQPSSIYSYFGLGGTPTWALSGLCFFVFFFFFFFFFPEKKREWIYARCVGLGRSNTHYT